MIFDHRADFSHYVGVHPLFGIVSGYFNSRQLSDLSPGIHDIGRGIRIIVDDYSTIDEKQGVVESHENFVDIHSMIQGAERIGIAYTGDCRVLKSEPDKDVSFLEGRVDFVTLNPGYFLVAFPRDGHMPKIAVDRPRPVRKAVFKIPVSGRV